MSDLSNGDQLIVLDLQQKLEPVYGRRGCATDSTRHSSRQQQLRGERSSSQIK